MIPAIQINYGVAAAGLHPIHLIEVVGRRSDAASPDRVRQMARQVLRERRADEAYQDWLRQSLDRAYVEMRLEER